MDKNLNESTIVLNKYASGDFLDFDSPGELKEVMRILNKLMQEKEYE